MDMKTGVVAAVSALVIVGGGAWAWQSHSQSAMMHSDSMTGSANDAMMHDENDSMMASSSDTMMSSSSDSMMHDQGSMMQH